MLVHWQAGLARDGVELIGEGRSRSFGYAARNVKASGAACLGHLFECPALEGGI
jgi:hypothetical protein